MRPNLVRLAAPAAVRTIGAGSKSAVVCPLCASEMDAWHCRDICPKCGYQIDCSDPE
jgi:hypothetical protein